MSIHITPSPLISGGHPNGIETPNLEIPDLSSPVSKPAETQVVKAEVPTTPNAKYVYWAIIGIIMVALVAFCIWKYTQIRADANAAQQAGTAIHAAAVTKTVPGSTSGSAASPKTPLLRVNGRGDMHLPPATKSEIDAHTKNMDALPTEYFDGTIGDLFTCDNVGTEMSQYANKLGVPLLCLDFRKVGRPAEIRIIPSIHADDFVVEGTAAVAQFIEQQSQQMQAQQRAQQVQQQQGQPKSRSMFHSQSPQHVPQPSARHHFTEDDGIANLDDDQGADLDAGDGMDCEFDPSLLDRMRGGNGQDLDPVGLAPMAKLPQVGAQKISQMAK